MILFNHQTEFRRDLHSIEYIHVDCCDNLGRYNKGWFWHPPSETLRLVHPTSSIKIPPIHKAAEIIPLKLL